MTDAELFKAAAEAVYGAVQWQQPLARDLGVDVRNVLRWTAGTREVPKGIWAGLEKLMVEHLRSTLLLSRTVTERVTSASASTSEPPRSRPR